MTISLQKAVIIKQKYFAGLLICVLATSLLVFQGQLIIFFSHTYLHFKVVLVYRIKNNDDFIMF